MAGATKETGRMASSTERDSTSPRIKLRNTGNGKKADESVGLARLKVKKTKIKALIIELIYEVS